jgi:hypothetical protein
MNNSREKFVERWNENHRNPYYRWTTGTTIIPVAKGGPFSLSEIGNFAKE